MTIKINKDKYNALRWAVSYITTDKNMDLYETNCLILDETKLNWGVNWSAIGTTSVAETMKFAEELQDIAFLGATLNSMDLEMVWEDDENLHALLESDPERAKRGWANYKQLIVDQLQDIINPTNNDKAFTLQILSDLLTAEIPH